MANIKSIIARNFENTLQQLRAAAAWGEITEKDLKEGEKIEEEITKNTTELNETGENLTQKKNEILAIYPQHHVENQFAGIKYGDDAWFERKENAIKSRTLRKVFDEKRELELKKESIAREISELNKSLQKSVDKISSDLNKIRYRIEMTIDATEKLKEEEEKTGRKVRVDVLEGFLKENRAWVNTMEEAVGRLAASLRQGDKKTVAEDLKLLNEIRGIMGIDEGLIAKIKKEIDQIKKAGNVEKGNILGKYYIFCTNRAESNFKNPTLLALFKNNFSQIVRMWEQIASSRTDAWKYIGQSEVARGELSKSVRIIYEIKGNNVYVYDICFHTEYNDLIKLLKDGRYKAMKAPTKPLNEFYAFEKMAA